MEGGEALEKALRAFIAGNWWFRTPGTLLYAHNGSKASANWLSKSPSDLMADVEYMLKQVGDRMADLPAPLPRGYEINERHYEELKNSSAFIRTDFGDLPFRTLPMLGVQIWVGEDVPYGVVREVW